MFKRIFLNLKFFFVISSLIGITFSDQRKNIYSTKISSDKVYIYPSADSPQIAGNEFWINICIGDSGNPVYNLYGTAFVLNWNGEWIELVTPAVEKGDFLGIPNEVEVESWLKPPPDTLLAVAATRIDTNRRTVNGFGTVIKIRFRAKSETPNNTKVCFKISEITAVDSTWNPIILIPYELCIIIKTPLGIRPNPFTPNNDGFNDRVEFNIKELTENGGVIIIFNLWGKEVRQVENDIYWDGRDNNGILLQPGSYLYVVKSRGKIIAKGILGLAR